MFFLGLKCCSMVGSGKEVRTLKDMGLEFDLFFWGETQSWVVPGDIPL